MDLSKFKVGDWLLVGGGAVMLIFGFALPWRTANVAGISVSGDNAFDFFLTGGVAYLLVVAAGVVTFLLAGGFIKADQVPWPLVMLGATGLATLLMLLRLLLGSGYDEVDRGSGMFVAFLAAGAALAGAVLNFTSAGGNLKDLTDLDKLKSAFGGTDAGRTPPPPPPPPPPAGGSIPPPPPPPAP